MGDKEKMVWALKTGDIEVVRANLVTVRNAPSVIQSVVWYNFLTSGYLAAKLTGKLLAHLASRVAS